LTPGETYAFHLIIFDGNARAEISNPFQLTTPLPPRDNSVDALLVAASVGTTLGLCYVIWRKAP